MASIAEREDTIAVNLDPHQAERSTSKGESASVNIFQQFAVAD
jgi:hypothetical protein